MAGWLYQILLSLPAVERQIQTIENIQQKAKQAGTNANIALLCLQVTLLSNKLSSTAEILNNHDARCNMISKTPTPRFLNQDHIQQELQHRQDQQKAYYNKSAHDLPPLIAGQPVRVLNEHGHWLPATIISKCSEPRSYMVESQERSYKRNRVQIRNSSEVNKLWHVYFSDPITHLTHQTPTNTQINDTNTNSKSSIPSDTNMSTTAEHKTLECKAKTTRSGQAT